MKMELSPKEEKFMDLLAEEIYSLLIKKTKLSMWEYIKNHMTSLGRLVILRSEDKLISKADIPNDSTIREVFWTIYIYWGYNKCASKSIYISNEDNKWIVTFKETNNHDNTVLLENKQEFIRTFKEHCIRKTYEQVNLIEPSMSSHFKQPFAKFLKWKANELNMKELEDEFPEIKGTL